MKEFLEISSDNDKQKPINYNLEKRIEELTEKIIETTNFIRENNFNND